MAMSADLGKALEDFVENLVKTGRYRSRSEVLREGIRLVQEREAKLAALDALVLEGLQDIDAGRIHPAEEVFGEIRAELEAMKGKRRAG